jgi:hypothetical protein
MNTSNRQLETGYMRPMQRALFPTTIHYEEKPLSNKNQFTNLIAAQETIEE